MDIYFDYGFIKTFESHLHNPEYSLRKGMRKLLDVFDDYNGVFVFSNVPVKQILNHYIFQRLLNNNGVHDGEKVFRERLNASKVSPQILAFFAEKHDESMADEVRKKGGLCFTEQNYLDEIERFLNFEQTVYLKYGDSVKFSWSKLHEYGFNNETCLLIDKYLLTSEVKVCEHFIPLLKGLFSVEKNNRITIISASEEQGIYSGARALVSQFCQQENIESKSIEIIAYDSRSRFNFHDRYLFGRYVAIDSGRGFDNLFKKYAKRSDAKLKIRTVFTKETYDDFKELIPVYQDYIDWHNLSKNQNFTVPFKS